jgi:hypothetical protein
MASRHLQHAYDHSPRELQVPASRSLLLHSPNGVGLMLPGPLCHVTQLSTGKRNVAGRTSLEVDGLLGSIGGAAFLQGRVNPRR